MKKSFLTALTKKQKIILAISLLFIGFQFILRFDTKLVKINKDEKGHLVRPANNDIHYLSLDEFNDSSKESQTIYNNIKDVVDNNVVPDMLKFLNEVIDLSYNPSRGTKIIKDISKIDISDYLDIAN